MTKEIKRIRLKDVAEQAGVSAMAVSSALSGKGRISTEKALYIRKVAAKMGYKTNAAAQILKRKKGGDMGMIIMETAEVIRPNTSLAEMTIVFSEACRKLNVRPQIEWFDYQANSKQLPDMFFNGLVDGLLVYGYGSKAINDTLNGSIGIPFVRMMEPGNYSVYLDTRQEIKDIVDYLYSCGHRSLVMINGEAGRGFHVFKTAQESFHDSTAKYGLKEPALYYYEWTSDYIKDIQHFTEEISRNRPDAVIVHNASRAKSLICELIIRGIMVPDDVSVICFDSRDFDCDFNIPITATNSDVAEVVRQSVKLLRARMENTALSHTSIAIRPLLVERNSVKRLLI